MRWLAGAVAVVLIGSTAPVAVADDASPAPGPAVSATPTPSASPQPQQPPVEPPHPSAPATAETPAVLVSARPVVTGTAKVGYRLIATAAGWSPGARLSYQWLRNGVAIKGATTSGYWLVKADQGKRIAVRVTGVLAGVAPGAATSAAVTAKSSSTGKKLTTPFVVKGVLVVNKDHRISKRYITKGPGVLGSKKEASAALKKLLKAAKKAGYSVQASSGYRSYATQTAIWKRNVKALGKKRGEQLAAPPGASEHNAGLAFDLRSGGRGQYAFGSSKAGKWIAKNAHKYGFILRYPKGMTKITGYAYEPWHFRYIGTEHAKAFAKNKKLTLEQYLGLA